MTPRPTPARDIALSLGLLTRLPLPVDAGYAQARGAGAAWAYPIAGLPVALAAGTLGWGALALGLPGATAAVLALAVQIVLTGAMHEDGLADSADGLWGGWERTRRLEIMKDSRIGTYGVLALIVSLLLRGSLLAALGQGMLPAMLAAALLSRAAMVTVMAALPHARSDGLSKSVGRPGARAVLLACALALVASLTVLGAAGVALALAAAASAIAAALIARRKIGGQTGDILGATQQLAEAAALAAAVIIAA